MLQNIDEVHCIPRQVKLQVDDNSCAKLQSTKYRWQGRPEMKPVKLRSVILDMDGTITRFNLDSKGVKLTILAELEKLNLRSPDMTERSSILTLLKQMKDRLDTETYDKVRNQFYRLLEEMEVKAAQETAFHPGVLDTLHKLRQRGLLLGLVTNNSRKGTDISLERLGLNGFFQVVVTRDECQEMKPNPESLKKALKELNVRADEAIFVGDSVNDIIAAKKAGLSSVAVSSGSASMEQLISYEPDYILGSLNDLPSLIGSF